MVVALVALSACSGGGETTTSCTSTAEAIAPGDSRGMGGMSFAIACPDSVARSLRCVSTAADNPTSADMRCTCTAAGSADSTFTLAAADRGRLPYDERGLTFIAPSCSWTLP